MATIPAERVADILDGIEDDILDNASAREPWLSDDERSLFATFEEILTRAVEDGMPVIVSNGFAEVLFVRASGISHTDFVGGDECTDCRGTFWTTDVVKKNTCPVSGCRW